MPIKEIVAFGAAVFTMLFVINGPLHFRDAVRKLQIQILRDISRTDNWGDPMAPVRTQARRR